MKKFKTSFLLGKFLPPTRGHCFLIDSASKNSDKVYVLMCSLKREPIAGELRYKWLSEIYKDSNVEVIWVQDENPQYPEEDPINFWDIWMDTFKRHLPERVEAVFSSEDYGFEIAKRMGIEHVLVDKNRITVPICATNVRVNPFKEWEFIPDNVRQHFIKKVVLLGTESSGKSTMCERLAEKFKTTWVKEYGRYYTENIKEDLSINDFYNIVNGQKELVKSELEHANKIIFCDTETITTKIFSELYCPNEYKEGDNFFENEIKSQKYDLYILLDYNTEFIQDGNRRFRNERSKHYNMIKNELIKYNIPYIEVSGESYDLKFNTIVNIIEDMFF